jgi:hypothetical protein
MHGVSVNLRASRAHTWLDGAGDWTWPGQGGAASVELLPPAWVPTFPRRLDQTIAQPVLPATWRSRRATWRSLLVGVLLASVAVVSATLALHGQLGVERLLGVRTAAQPAPVPVVTSAAPQQPLPTLVAESQDAAGSSIDTSSYPSSALRGQGSFIAYLPPGYAATTRRYPVLYLLDGNNQSARAFLEVGLQGQLDRLIARRAIPPLIAVMIQGGPGATSVGTTKATSWKCRNWWTGRSPRWPIGPGARSPATRWAAMAR